jgi:hypothetical protein
MVHQGDQDGVKGVYHLNMVDEVTQWQVVGAVEHISQAWLKPALARPCRELCKWVEQFSNIRADQPNRI